MRKTSKNTIDNCRRMYALFIRGYVYKNNNYYLKLTVFVNFLFLRYKWFPEDRRQNAEAAINATSSIARGLMRRN